MTGVVGCDGNQLRLSTAESHARSQSRRRSASGRRAAARGCGAGSAVPWVLAVSFWLWKTTAPNRIRSPSRGATDNQQTSLHSGKRTRASETAFPPGHSFERSTGHNPAKASGNEKGTG